MIPTENELIEFIKKHDLINYSIIAKHFKIKNSTVSDLIQSLQEKQLITIKQLGASKVVRLKK